MRYFNNLPSLLHCIYTVLRVIHRPNCVFIVFHCCSLEVYTVYYNLRNWRPAPFVYYFVHFKSALLKYNQNREVNDDPHTGQFSSLVRWRRETSAAYHTKSTRRYGFWRAGDCWSCGWPHALKRSAMKSNVGRSSQSLGLDRWPIDPRSFSEWPGIKDGARQAHGRGHQPLLNNHYGHVVSIMTSIYANMIRLMSTFNYGTTEVS